MTQQRYVDESDEFFIDDSKGSSNSLRQETELFNDESYVAHPLISVRRVALPKGGEDWEIVVDKKPVLELKGSRFSKQEREFLRSPNGMVFLINGFKNGWKSVSEYKRQVLKCLK